MSLLRRIDDALCAFRTGHSRRDADRVRLRRILLLAQRHRRVLVAEDKADEFGFHRPWLETFSGLIDDLLKGVDRPAADFLAGVIHHHLLFGRERCLARAKAGNEIPGDARNDARRSGEPRGAGARQRRRQLDRGLHQSAVHFPFDRKFGFGIGQWHFGVRLSSWVQVPCLSRADEAEARLRDDRAPKFQAFVRRLAE